jgi:hypothetical protein
MGETRDVISGAYGTKIVVYEKKNVKSTQTGILGR